MLKAEKVRMFELEQRKESTAAQAKQTKKKTCFRQKTCYTNIQNVSIYLRSARMLSGCYCFQDAEIDAALRSSESGMCRGAAVIWVGKRCIGRLATEVVLRFFSIRQSSWVLRSPQCEIAVLLRLTRCGNRHIFVKNKIEKVMIVLLLRIIT